MPATDPIDYAALAEQARQSTPPPAAAGPVDYAALADQARQAAPAGGAMNFAIVNGRRVPIDDATDEPTPPASLWDQANTSPLHHYFEAARKAVDETIAHAPLDRAEAQANDWTGPLHAGTVSATLRGGLAGGLEGALNYGESFTTPIGAVLALTGLTAESAIVKQIPALKPLINLPAVQALRTAVHTAAGGAFAAHGAGTIYGAATDPAASTSEKLERAAQGTFELAGGALGVAPAVERGAAYWAQQRRTAAGAAAIADFKKTAPPSAAAPYDEAQLHKAYPELVDEHHTTGPITTIADARDAADRRIAYYEKGINDTIATNPTELIQTRPLDEVRAKLGASVRADALTKGLAKLESLGLDRPLTVDRANAIRQQLNAEIADELRANGYDRAEARKVDPGFAAREAAAESLRNGIADVLDQRVGVGGFTRATREQQGALIAVRDALQRQAFKNEARVGGTGTTSTTRKIAAGAVKLAGAGAGFQFGESVGGHYGAGLGTLAGLKIADPIAALIDRPPLTRDQLIERSFGYTKPGTGLQPTPGPPPPPVAPGAGPGGPGGAPGGPSAPAGPGLPPPGPVTPAPPQTPQQIAVATYAGLLGQGYPPALAKQMAITFARRVPETAPPGAPRQLGTGPRFVTTAAGETVPATAAGPQIPDYARVITLTNDYQPPAVDPSSVRAVPGTYAERVDAARTAPETMGGANAPAARLSRFATWKDDDLQFAADNGIPAVQAGAQAEIARRAALPPAEAAAATPAPTAAPTSSAPITDFTKFTQDALRYAADRGTPEYKAAAQAEIARRKGAAADRATARQQTRAEADAAEQQDLADLVAKAQANGYAGDPAALQAQLATRLQDIKDLHAAVDESGTNGITLLRAIAKNGGLSVTAAEAAGQGGELRWLKEFQDTKPSASRTNLKAPPVAVSGQVRGVGGVFRTATEQTRGGRAGGQDLGAMLERLHADGRFPHLTTTNELSDAIREAATGRADSRNAIKDLAANSRDLLYPAVDESFDPATLEATAADRANVRRGGFGAGPPRPLVDPAPPPPDRPNTTRGGFGAGQPPAAPVPDVPDTPPPASSASTSSAPAIKVIETPRPNGTAYLQVKNDAGAVGGEVANGQLRINAAEVSPRGQGLGQELYKRLIDQATQRGLTVVSDNTVEAAAVNVYTALERKGYTVTKNPRAFELTLEDGSKALGAPRGESVFTIAPPAEGGSSAPPAIRAYHGSPHDFEQFDTSKIGTGEGAAAYGHGLYFAEHPAVAEGYRTTLATPTAEAPAFRLRGEPVAIGTDHWQIAQLLETPKAGETPAAMVTRRIGELEDQAKFAARAYGEDAASMYHLQANRLRAIDPADLTFHRPGKTYEVNIHTDPEHLLDWDLPLSQQPERIRYVLGYQPPPTPAAVDAVIAEAKRRGVAPASLPEYQALQAQADAAAKMDRDYPNGAAIYNEWMHDARNLAIRQGRDPETTLPASQAAASEEFRKMGITGIRYLDQGSRNAGGWHITPPEQTTSKKWMVKSSDYNSKGLHFDTQAEAEAALAEKVKGQTRNYVVFDAKLIDILKKYGVLLPAAGLGVAAAGRMLRDRPDKGD